jgi:uncharacterized protein (TIGR00661 family)
MKRFNYRFKRNGESPTILVAVLHWGLGHATRCIPVITALLNNNYTVVIASDGAALELLRKEFPQLESIELPSYNISYSRKPIFFKSKLLLKLPRIKKTIAKEKKLVKKLVEAGKIQGIISDNRFGVRNKKVPSVFITHQLNVLSGNTSWLSSKAHQNIIRKFDECWVPDTEGPENLSGKLGHLKRPLPNVKYIGPLSRMQSRSEPKQYDVLCLLSGPEPQRGMLEELCFNMFRNGDKKVLIVRGVVKDKEHRTKLGNLCIVNYLGTIELEKVINASDLIISRSGYTTIMDLAAMGRKAFFIPTPGQYEQEYLAKRLRSKGIIPSCSQDAFTHHKLSEVAVYKGFQQAYAKTDLGSLFSLFKGE